MIARFARYIRTRIDCSAYRFGRETRDVGPVREVRLYVSDSLPYNPNRFPSGQRPTGQMRNLPLLCLGTVLAEESTSSNDLFHSEKLPEYV